jgi:hypothetical protein
MKGRRGTGMMELKTEGRLRRMSVKATLDEREAKK